MHFVWSESRPNPEAPQLPGTSAISAISKMALRFPFDGSVRLLPFKQEDSRFLLCPPSDRSIRTLGKGL